MQEYKRELLQVISYCHGTSLTPPPIYSCVHGHRSHFAECQICKAQQSLDRKLSDLRHGPVELQKQSN